MNIKLELQQFDLKAFIQMSIENGIMTPNVFSMHSPQRFGNEELKERNTDELYHDLIHNGKYVYVNFSNFGINHELTCIDGEEYLYVREEDVEDYFEDEEVPKNFQPAKHLKIYEDSSVGYLLKYDGEILTVQSSIIHVMFSRIDIQDNVEILNQPMKLYLEKFMK
nr:hypothetical protein [Neobacillus sp. Marseille-Q6967]